MKKRIISLILAAVMMVSTLPLPALAAEQPSNVDLSRYASALGAENPNAPDEGPYYALDNNRNTKWCMYGTGWLCFTLDEAALAQQLTICHAGSSASETCPYNTVDFDLQVLDTTKVTEAEFYANDNKYYLMDQDAYWTTVASVRGNSADITNTVISLTEARRLYRLDVLNAGSDNTTRIYEVELYGAVPFEEPVNLARSAAVMGTQYDSPNTSEVGASAFDGDPYNTKWCMRNKGWLCFDLKNSTSLHHMRVYHAGCGVSETARNNTASFQLEVLNESRIRENDFLSLSPSDRAAVMNNDANWTKVVSVTGNKDDVSDTPISTAERHRIYRFHITDAGRDNTTRIYEIELYRSTPAASVRVENGTASVGGRTVHSALPGTGVMVKAAPGKNGRIFDHWRVYRGDVAPKNVSPSSFIMPEGDVYLEAIYSVGQSAYDIQVERGTAFVSGGGVHSAAPGAEVTLIADAPGHSETFASWRIDADNGDAPIISTSSTCTFTMPTAPVRATARYTKEIDQVSISGLEMPILGEHPDFTVEVPEDVPYHPASRYELSTNGVGSAHTSRNYNGLWWIDNSINNFMTPEWVFKKSTENVYSVEIVLARDHLSRFTENPTVVVNGRTVTDWKTRLDHNTIHIISPRMTAKPAVEPLPAPTVSVSLGQDNKPVLTWNKIQDAVKYEVRAAENNGSFQTLTTITGTKLTHTSAKAGSSYEYQVRAIGDVAEANSDWSRSVTITVPKPVEPPKPVEKLPAPRLQVFSDPDSGKPILTWDPVEGAAKYEVYRQVNSQGDFEYFHSPKGTSTSLRHGSAVPGSTYGYQIRAIAADGTPGEWSYTVYCTCDLARPHVTVSARADGKPVLTWNKVDDAASYLVYYSTNGGDFQKLSPAKGTKLSHGSAKPGNTYTYKVQALTGQGYADSEWSEEVSFTVAQQTLEAPTLTVTNKRTTGKPYLKWNKVDGAEEYEVYRATSKSGEYTRLWGGSSTALTNGSAKAGTTYYYKVRALAADGTTSEWSEIRTRTCDLAQPDVKVTLRSDGKPVLTWQKVSGAVKYEVWRRTDGGDFVRLTTVSGTKLTNSSAKSGHTYTYKVRALASRSAANSSYSYYDTIKAK